MVRRLALKPLSHTRQNECKYIPPGKRTGSLLPRAVGGRGGASPARGGAGPELRFSSPLTSGALPVGGARPSPTCRREEARGGGVRCACARRVGSLACVQLARQEAAGCARYRTGLCAVQGRSGEGIRMDSALTLEALKLPLQPNRGRGLGRGCSDDPLKQRLCRPHGHFQDPDPVAAGCADSAHSKTASIPAPHPPRSALFLPGGFARPRSPSLTHGGGRRGWPGSPARLHAGLLTELFGFVSSRQPLKTRGTEGGGGVPNKVGAL